MSEARLLVRCGDAAAPEGLSKAKLTALAAKRALDVTLALIAILVLLPVFVMLAVIVKLDGGPAFYSHTRIGRGGREFGCLKFRSMVRNSDDALRTYLQGNPTARAEWEHGRKLKFDPRVTKIGDILRRTSLDELPQIFNVLRGEMSLVGPRPVVKDELELYGEARADYMKVRPGITGLWQVSGRSELSYDSRVALDRSYVRQWSLASDLAILAATVPAVLLRRGAV